MSAGPRNRTRGGLRAIVLAAAASVSLGAAPARETVDLLIRGGTIYTGSDAAFVDDVTVVGDRVRYVGLHANVMAARTIDARGMIVAPGFIDPHTHADKMLASEDARERLVLAFLLQGVTTAFIGNDGSGALAVRALFDQAGSMPLGINYAAYVGFGSVRGAVIGPDDRQPTPAELHREKALVAQTKCEGAMGLSTGLFYVPQSFAEMVAVAALAAEAAARGGTYDSHIRDESSYTIGLDAAVEEAIAIGREAGLPVHISHIKALGDDVQGSAPRIVAMVEAARARGEKVTADQYLWSASGTSLVASLVPRWAQDGGREALLRRFEDASLAGRLGSDMAENVRKRGGADMLLITSGPFEGKRLAQVAAERDSDVIAAAIAVIRIGDPAVASFNQSEADIASFMQQPWVMTGSDSSTGHPRTYGSFARKYETYVIEKQVINLADFIHRSTTLTADTFDLAGRGDLRSGAFADIVVFDPERYAPAARMNSRTSLPAACKA